MTVLSLARNAAEQRFLERLNDAGILGNGEGEDEDAVEDYKSAQAALDALRDYTETVQRDRPASRPEPQTVMPYAGIEADPRLKSTQRAWSYAMFAYAYTALRVEKYRCRYLGGSFLTVEDIPAFLEKHDRKEPGKPWGPWIIEYGGRSYRGANCGPDAIFELAAATDVMNSWFGWLPGEEPYAVRFVLAGETTEYVPTLNAEVSVSGVQVTLHTPVYFSAKHAAVMRSTIMRRLTDAVPALQSSFPQFDAGKATALAFVVPRRVAGDSWETIANQWDADKPKDCKIKAESLRAIYSKACNAAARSLQPQLFHAARREPPEGAENEPAPSSVKAGGVPARQKGV